MYIKSRIRQFFPSLVVFFMLLSTAALFAFTAPTATPPNDNVSGPINISTEPQAKGGQVITGSLLDINGIFSSDVLFVQNDARFGLEGSGSGDLTIGSLAGVGVRPVCVDDNDKLIICGNINTPSYDLSCNNVWGGGGTFSWAGPESGSTAFPDTAGNTSVATAGTYTISCTTMCPAPLLWECSETGQSGSNGGTCEKTGTVDSGNPSLSVWTQCF